MPDLSIEYAWTCNTNLGWETTVNGSKGDQYKVRWTRTPNGDAMYGWTCECKGFQYRGDCKHVRQVRESGARCGWNSELDPTARAHLDRTDNVHKCPDCGEIVTSFRVGV